MKKQQALILNDLIQWVIQTEQPTLNYISVIFQLKVQRFILFGGCTNAGHKIFQEFNKIGHLKVSH